MTQQDKIDYENQARIDKRNKNIKQLVFLVVLNVIFWILMFTFFFDYTDF
jgi:hypothetical protein